MTVIKDFATATVGEHACTWERAEAPTLFLDYGFETAGNPQDLWEQGVVVRKLWRLVEVTVMSGVDDEVTS